jgi:hypothetical protein
MAENMTIDAAVSLSPDMLVITERHAVYRCYSDQGELLYIGTSGNLGKRLATHAEKVWFLQVRGITLEWYADELTALNAERRAIHVECPKYNVQHRNGALRHRKPKKRPISPVRMRPSSDERRNLAASILAAEPHISGGELGRRIGTTTRYGCMLKNRLAGTVTGAGEVNA